MPTAKAAIGKFSAGDRSRHQSRRSPSRGLATDLAHAVRPGRPPAAQLLIHPGEFPDIFEVEVQLTSASGDDRSWHRMNRTFLAELRKQFLQWRTLSRERMQAYATQSQKLSEQPLV